MLRLVLKEIKIKAFLFFLSALGQAVLYALIFVLSDFSAQFSDSYWKNLDPNNFVTLRCDAEQADKIDATDELLYARAKGLTYDVSVSYETSSVYLPDYRGGVCVCSINESLPVITDVICGDGFDADGQRIWLSDGLSDQLGCGVSDVVTLENKKYFVAGIYSNDAHFLHSRDENASFFVFCDLSEIGATDSLILVIADANSLLRQANSSAQKVFYDDDGILQLCKGYNVLQTGILFAVCFLAALFSVFYIAIFKIYFDDREEYLRLLNTTGLSYARSFLMFFSVFAIVTIVSFLISVLCGAVFYGIVTGWAESILKVTIKSPDYILSAASGIAVCFAMSCAVLPFMLKKRALHREENE